MSRRDDRKRQRRRIDRRAACLGKKQYQNQTHARNDARALKRKDGRNMSVYHCHFCDHYHVGHTPWYRRSPS